MAVRYPRVPQRTTPGFAFSMVDRALKDCLATRKFGMEEVQQAVGFLFPRGAAECTYCGSSNVERWDHLVPITAGGETVIGNMVPACGRCDDSKRDLRYDDWMTSDYPSAPRNRGVTDIESRRKRIKSYIEHFSYTPRTLEQRLNRKELRTLKDIRSRLRALRADVDGLIETYRGRAGAR
jgi:hypothetical protein